MFVFKDYAESVFYASSPEKFIKVRNWIRNYLTTTEVWTLPENKNAASEIMEKLDSIPEEKLSSYDVWKDVDRKGLLAFLKKYYHIEEQLLENQESTANT